MSETEFRIKTKLIGYRSERSSEEIQINLVFTLIRRLKLLFVFRLKITNLLLKKEKLLKIY